jgi:hypothetical protein
VLIWESAGLRHPRLAGLYVRERNRIRLVASANASIIAAVIRELDRVCPYAS